MSSENIELVRNLVDRFNLRGPERMLVDTFWAEDAEVLPAAAFPEGGPYKGRDQIDRFFAGLSEGWDSLSVVIRETQAVGDHVFVLFEWRAIGEASHIEVASQWFAVYTIRAGQIVRLQFFDDREAARSAVGLA